MSVIKELAISGGGIKGIAFLGSLYQMEKLGLLNDIQKISGSSIGAFLAACLVIGYKPSEMIDELFEYNYSKIKDIDLINTYTRKSIMKGDKLRNFFKEIFEKKINPEITLKELYDITKIDFIVTAVCVNTQSLEYISHNTDPDLDLFTLICMSSAIPGFLPPVHYKNKLYIDGGIIDNLPMKVLSNDAWGLSSTRGETCKFINTENLDYFKHFSLILKMIYSGFQRDKKYQVNNKNIIKVKVGNIEVTSFNINKDQKLSLIKSGINAINEKFNHNSLIQDR